MYEITQNLKTFSILEKNTTFSFQDFSIILFSPSLFIINAQDDVKKITNELGLPMRSSFWLDRALVPYSTA